MKYLVLAILTAGLLLDGTDKAIAECRTQAEARASSPGSYLAYHVVAGARCWFPGYPRRPQLLAAKEPRPEPAKPANDGKAYQPPPEQERVSRPAEAEMAAAPSDPWPTARHRIADTFHVIGSEADDPDDRQSFQALQRQAFQRQVFQRQVFQHQVLGAYADRRLDHDPAQDVQLPWQPSAPAKLDARPMALAVRIALFIGIFMTIAISVVGLLRRPRHRTSHGFAYRTGSLRQYPSQGLHPLWNGRA